MNKEHLLLFFNSYAGKERTQFCGGDSLGGRDDGELLTGRLARLLPEEAVRIAGTTAVRELLTLARRGVEMEASLGGPTRTGHGLLVADICKTTKYLMQEIHILASRSTDHL